MAKKVLISGASIAGPTAGIVLGRAGIETTIVEKSSSLRDGGYPVDIRGAALDVTERLGLLSDLRKSHVDMQRITITAAGGRKIGPFHPYLLSGGSGPDAEVPRGAFAAVLYEASKDIVKYRFNDSIASVKQDSDGVDVFFSSGHQERYDIVIGAEGLHSNLRQMVFGPESQFERYIGYCFTGFSLPNPERWVNDIFMHNAPGKLATIFAAHADRPLISVMAFRYPGSPFTVAPTPAQQRELTAQVYKDERDGIVPRLLEALETADDLYFDTVSQIRMPKWSSGRVVLSGDAAHATSFLSGQGTSVALVGSYVLANEIATKESYEEAFAAYEAVFRNFAEINQDLVHGGSSVMIPDTMEEIDQRNAAIEAALAAPGSENDLHGDYARPHYSAIDLPAYN